MNLIKFMENSCIIISNDNNSSIRLMAALSPRIELGTIYKWKDQDFKDNNNHNNSNTIGNNNYSNNNSNYRSLKVYLGDWLIGETVNEIKSTQLNQFLLVGENLSIRRKNLSEQSRESVNSINIELFWNDCRKNQYH